MQTIKDKLHDMSAMREAKAEAKAEEQAEKELAKARVEVAHEVRKAREAEAQMDLHVNKAAQRVDKEIAKHHPDQLGADDNNNQFIVGVTDDRRDHHHLLPVNIAGGDPNMGATTGTTNNTACANPNPNFL